MDILILSSLIMAKKLYKAQNKKFIELTGRIELSYDDLHNSALIHLRRQNLLATKGNIQFQNKIKHFNKVVASKDIRMIGNIIRYYLRQDEK